MLPKYCPFGCHIIKTLELIQVNADYSDTRHRKMMLFKQKVYYVVILSSKYDTCYFNYSFHILIVVTLYLRRNKR